MTSPLSSKVPTTTGGDPGGAFSGAARAPVRAAAAQRLPPRAHPQGLPEADPCAVEARAAEALPEAVAAGAVLTEYNLDERRFFAKFAAPERDAFDLARFREMGAGLSYEDAKDVRRAARVDERDGVRRRAVVRHPEAVLARGRGEGGEAAD